MEKISIKTAEHYKWGEGCDGWHLLKTDSLNVIREHMMPGTCEQMHYHEKAQQLFCILEGCADVELEGKTMRLYPGESIHVEKGRKHRICNNGDEVLVFLLISEPRAQTDRVNV
jgi:mannose-6-phosphate isomerase-like protein (cupin superfamily)